MKRECRFLGPWRIVILIAIAALLPGRQAWADGQKRKIEPLASMGHSDTVYAVAFSPDGAQVLSGSRDKTLKLWDTVSGHLIRTFAGHSEPVVSVAFSPDGARVLSGSDDKTMKLWDVRTGQLLHTFMERSAWVASVAFSPDGKHVLSGGDDKTLKLWDAATGQLVRTYTGHSSTVTSVAFSRDGSRILSGSKDGTLKLWDTVSGHLIRTVKVHSEGDAGVQSVALSRDDSRLLSVSFDNKARLWDAANGELIHTFEGEWGEDRSAAISPDGKQVLTFLNGSLKRWDTVTGGELQSFPEGKWSVTFSPDGSRILSADGDTLRLMDAANGREIRTFEGYGAEVTRVAFSLDGSRILSGNKHTLQIWDAVGARPLPSSDIADPLAFSADGTLVLSGGGVLRGTLALQNASSGQLIRSFGQGTSSAAFSRDGSRIVSSDRDKIYLWDAASGRLIQSFEGHAGDVHSVAFSPDGTRILSGSDDVTLKLWDAASGQILHSFDEHADTINSVAFSPDGTRILSGSDDNTLKMWDALSWQLLHTFKGHSGSVRSVAFSPDGTRILSGAKDYTVKLWDAATGKELQNFAGHTNTVNSVAFSSNGHYAVSGSSDGTVRVWNTGNGQQLAGMIASGADWLALTPNGFFAASQRDTGLLAIVRGIEVTTIGQVHQSLLNPDLVREALAGDPNGEVKRAAEAVNLDKVLDAGPSPAIAITSHEAGRRSDKDLVTVAARITDRGKGIGRIEWRINGVTAGVTSAPDGVGTDREVKQELALDPGNNKIEVIAYEGRNLLASQPAQTTIDYDGPADTAKPKLYILAIGINDYIDRGGEEPGTGRILLFPPLLASVPDAEAFSAEMEKAGAGLYSQVRVILALDRDATLAKLDETVGSLAHEISPRDTFVFYAAAHGYTVGGKYYLIPQDYQGGPDPVAVRTLGIGQERIQGWIANRIKAKRALILLDTCESGALTGGYAKSRTEGPVSEAAVGRLNEATGRPVLTAAAPGKHAFENYKGHGVFTYALMEALHKGDTNNNGKIEVSELAAHIEKRVPELFAELKQSGWVVKGLAAAPVLRGGSGEEDTTQTAHFGSTGEDFSIVARLP